MKSNIKIPVPCNENWQTMSIRGQGRFCDKCCHVVVDFSGKTNAEISNYLKEKSGERVCGRIKSDQLNNLPISQVRPAHRYKIFFAALYFVFGGLLFTSCSNQNEEVMGKIE